MAGGGGRSTPSVFSSRFSVAKGGFRPTFGYPRLDRRLVLFEVHFDIPGHLGFLQRVLGVQVVDRCIFGAAVQVHWVDADKEHDKVFDLSFVVANPWVPSECDDVIRRAAVSIKWQAAAPREH